MNNSNAISEASPRLTTVLSTIMGTVILFAIGLATLTLLAG
jgi:hypothetical protein